MVTVGYRNPFACVKKTPHSKSPTLLKMAVLSLDIQGLEDVAQGGGTTLQGRGSGTDKLVTQSVIGTFRDAVFGM